MPTPSAERLFGSLATTSLITRGTDLKNQALQEPNTLNPHFVSASSVHPGLEKAARELEQHLPSESNPNFEIATRTNTVAGEQIFVHSVAYNPNTGETYVGHGPDGWQYQGTYQFPDAWAALLYYEKGGFHQNTAARVRVLAKTRELERAKKAHTRSARELKELRDRMYADLTFRE